VAKFHRGKALLAKKSPALKRIVMAVLYRRAEALLPRINAGAAT